MMKLRLKIVKFILHSTDKTQKCVNYTDKALIGIYVLFLRINSGRFTNPHIFVYCLNYSGFFNKSRKLSIGKSNWQAQMIFSRNLNSFPGMKFLISQDFYIVFQPVYKRKPFLHKSLKQMNMFSRNQEAIDGNLKGKKYLVESIGLTHLNVKARIPTLTLACSN